MNIWRNDKRRLTPQQASLPGLVTPTQIVHPQSRRLATPHEQALSIAHNRIIIGIIIFSLAYLIIAGRLTFLTLLSETPDLPMAHHDMNESVASALFSVVLV